MTHQNGIKNQNKSKKANNNIQKNSFWALLKQIRISCWKKRSSGVTTLLLENVLQPWVRRNHDLRRREVDANCGGAQLKWGRRRSVFEGVSVVNSVRRPNLCSSELRESPVRWCEWLEYCYLVAVVLLWKCWSVRIEFESKVRMVWVWFMKVYMVLCRKTKRMDDLLFHVMDEVRRSQHILLLSLGLEFNCERGRCGC